MKLKGEVEVFKIYKDGTSQSVLKESNMVVDGASETIVDMLTTPFSIKNVAGSETLNPSNFTVQAVTLGKAEKLYGGHPDTSAADTDVVGMHGVYNNQNLSNTFFTSATNLFGDDWIGARNLVGTASSWLPSPHLPKDPHPRDTSLEDSSKTQIELYYEMSGLGPSGQIPDGGYPVPTYPLPFGVSNGWNNGSALIPSLGHNLNALYSRTVKSMESLYQGCYAPSDGMDFYLWTSNVTRRSVVTAYDPEAGLFASIQAETLNVSGRYNQMGSMDRNGYLVAYALQDHPASGDTTRGVAVSAGTTSSLASVSYTGEGLLDGSGNFIGSPAVVYNFSISAPDLLALAAYKGVTNIGLWTLDLKETLKNESPPFDWVMDLPNRFTNNRKYKLFSKKVFSEDLTTIQDNTTADLDLSSAAGIRNYVDLNIQWRLSFDFGDTF